MATGALATLIDGSVLEGGGQILRNSVSLSALLSKPVSIHRIRNGRKPPGLKNQHRTGQYSPSLYLKCVTEKLSLLGLQLAAEIAHANMTGAVNGSTEIDFKPGTISLPGHFLADSITAGSTTLLLQVALPLLLFSPQKAPSTLTLKGGTNATQAPQIDYTQHVFLPFARTHFGLDVELDIQKRGYFPRGGGEVVVKVNPTSGTLKNITLLDRGAVRGIKGIAHLAGLPGHLSRSMIEGAKRKLKAAGFPSDNGLTGAAKKVMPIEIESKREKNENSVGAGSGIVLWAELEGGGMIGGSAVGKRGVDPEKVGEEAAGELIRGLEADGCVDEVCSYSPDVW